MADNTTIDAMTGGDLISTEEITGSSPLYKIPRSKIALGEENVDGGNVSSDNPFPITTPDMFPGYDQFFGRVITSGKYIPICVSGFYNNAIFTQGKRILGKVTVSNPGSYGVRIKIYDDYYNRPPTDLKYDFDASIAHNYELDVIFNLGIYVIIADPGSGTAPVVTFAIE